MILFSVIFILLAAVVFFHYLQGFFAATLSAIISILSAMIAISYHEPLLLALLGGKFADSGFAITLVAIYALTYIIIRTIFDMVIPGNLRFPAIVDKVGGAVMGLVAGIFGVGIVTIAMQTMPLGSDTLGYSRVDMDGGKTQVAMPSGGTFSRAQDRDVPPGVKSEKGGQFGYEEFRSSLLLPIDEWTMNMAYTVSAGALGGSNKLSAVYPSYLDQMAAARLGIPGGAKITAMNLKSESVRIPEDALGKDPAKEASGFPIYQIVFPESGPAAANAATQPAIQAITRVEDGEYSEIRMGNKTRPLDQMFPERNKHYFITVTLEIEDSAAEEDRMVRMSPASVQLILDGRIFFPVGVLSWHNFNKEVGNTDPEVLTLFGLKVDDPIIIARPKDGRPLARFVFMIPKEGKGSIVIPKDLTKARPTFPDGTYLYVKRLVRLDLSGRIIGQPGEAYTPTGSLPGNDGILRKRNRR